MIAINLLPIELFKQQQKGKKFVAGFGAFMFLFVVGLASFKMFVLDINIEALESKVAGLESEKNRLIKAEEDATAITKATFRQWEQLEAIMEIEERRRDQTRLLVELEQLLPKQDAWYMKLEHKQGKLSIEGVARDKDTVSRFLKSLEHGEARYIDPYSVNPNQIAQNMVINNMTLTRFTLSANTHFPSPTLLNDGIEEINFPPKEKFLQLIKAASADLVQSREAGAKKKAGL